VLYIVSFEGRAKRQTVANERSGCAFKVGFFGKFNLERINEKLKRWSVDEGYSPGHDGYYHQLHY